MSAQAFDFIVITPEVDFPEEAIWVNRLFDKGLATLHVRKPGRSIERLLLYLDQIQEVYHGRIMVHYQEEVQKERGIKGIHFKYSALPSIKPEYTTSCGCHSWEELQEIESRVDYAFVSPFFNSISKEGYKARENLRELPEGGIAGKAIALGGVHQGNLLHIRRLGLKGAAVLGSVWGSENPLNNFLRLKTKMEELDGQE